MFKAITSVSEISATHHFTNPTKVGERVIPFLSWLFSNQPSVETIQVYLMQIKPSRISLNLSSL